MKPLILTPEQTAEILFHLKPGKSLVARVCREAFAGSNPDTSGRLLIEFVEISNSSLPALRELVIQAKAPAEKDAKRALGEVALVVS